MFLPLPLSDVARILLDCALRPEKCFRLRPENGNEWSIKIHFGKTNNAGRHIPMTPSIQPIIDMRVSKAAGGEWVFPPPTMSGHIEPSSLKRGQCQRPPAYFGRRVAIRFRWWALAGSNRGPSGCKSEGVPST